MMSPLLCSSNEHEAQSAVLKRSLIFHCLEYVIGKIAKFLDSTFFSNFS